jgi:CRISPR-associated protein Cas2
LIVLSISDCPPKLRGYLTKYLCEISTGVYVGKVATRVRDSLWQRVTENCAHGRAVMVYSSNTEQGFDYLTWGSSWIPMDLDGFKAMLHPVAEISDTNTSTPTEGHRSSKDEYVVLDLETTGLDIQNSRIIEIGALLISNGTPAGEYNTFIHQDGFLPEKIAELTGIRQKDVDAGAEFADALSSLSTFISGRLVIGYNIKQFDEKVLFNECRRHGLRSPLRKTQDILLMARRRFPDMRSHRQQVIAQRLGIAASDSHRALSDCYTCYEIYRRLTSPLQTDKGAK